MQNVENISHVINLESRKKLNVTGVNSVDGFSEQCLKLSVADGRVVILGENIKITSFNKANGNLSADGSFNEIKYLNKKENLLKKVFK